MTEQVDVVRLAQLHACVESSVRALTIGLRDAGAGELELARAWYGRAESSLAFAAALAEYLRARRCIAR